MSDTRHAWDLDVMRKTVWGEARGEGFTGMLAVAWVIMNRVHDGKRWNGETISQVCLSPWQFSCWNSDDPNRKLLDNIGLDNRELLAANGICSLVMLGGVVLAMADPTHASTHYCHKSIHPKWIDSPKMIFKTAIGVHRFYTEVD